MSKLELLDALGVEIICTWLEQGDSLHEIARRLDMSIGSLRDWGAKSAQRSARIRDARIDGAEWWEIEARRVLKDAFELAKANPTIAGAVVSLAKEQAQAAWRCATIRDPVRFETRRAAEVGVQVGVNVQTGQQMPARKLPTHELQRIAQLALTDVEDATVVREHSLTSSSEPARLLAESATPSPTPVRVPGNWVP
jgi:hypothetical protein